MEARSALNARGASRTMTARRPKIAMWICTRSMPPRCTNPTTTFPTEMQTAWRERPPRWPRAWHARRSKTVVAHATVLRLTASPTSSPIAGGTERRPSQTFSNSQRSLDLAEAVRYRSAFTSTTIRRLQVSARGNTSRGGGVPPLCSPSCSPLIPTADIEAFAARRSGLQIERAIKLRSGRRSDRRFKMSGERLRACDLGADHSTDKRGVSNPRTGSGDGCPGKTGGLLTPRLHCRR